MAQNPSDHMFRGPSYKNGVRWQGTTVLPTSMIGPEQRNMEDWVHLQSGRQPEPIGNSTHTLNHLKWAHPTLPQFMSSRHRQMCSRKQDL